ncbi:hypothetical protein K456DRAFT_28566 [Colletotrichum gloeosporioides 23]|nr:hypothetical protein K456DRAFT_28566 [Colletotrichum gloeosporioides 23]
MASLIRSSSPRGGSARYRHLDDSSEYALDGWQSTNSRHIIAPVTAETPSYQFSENVPLLGKPARKRMFYNSDIAMAIIAFACLALSVLVVSNGYISWYLGVSNRQLIVIGFLLSIMSLCLASVTPTLFILLEARFGNSTIQNYDAILRNKPLASSLSFAWRLILVVMLALPIGLSVAYKTFSGGESSMNIDTLDYLNNATYFGLFKPPGINLLAVGESWIITAPVIGTVATFNETATQDRYAFEEDFVSICTDAVELDDQWSHKGEDLYNGWSFALTDRRLHSDQSMQYIGLAPGNPNCTELSPYVYLYNIYRQPCLGTWSISRGSFQLLNGSCDDTILPWAKQQIIQWNVLALPAWYMPSLIEMLTDFCGSTMGDFRGNQSHWMMPYMSISVATMLWSRITTLQQTTTFDSETFNISSEGLLTENDTALTHGEGGVIYAVGKDDQIISYNRPTLQKSPWLYLVLGVQPALLLIILALIALFHSVPLGKGFGLISILSGIQSQSLNKLRGASLSGELKQPIKLAMIPNQDNDAGSNFIQYELVTSSKGMQRNGRLARNTVYD